MQVLENESDGEMGGGRGGGGQPSARARPRRVTFAQEHFSHSVTDYYTSGDKQLSERCVHILSLASIETEYYVTES